MRGLGSRPRAWAGRPRPWPWPTGATAMWAAALLAAYLLLYYL